MNNHSTEFNKFLVWEAISREQILVKTIYIDMAGGDHAAGMLLSQLVYWYLLPSEDGRSKLRVNRKGRMWVAKSRDEWYDEIRLKPRQFDRVAKLLRDLGVIETKTMKFAGVPKTHTRIVVDRFLEVWQQYAKVDTSSLPLNVKSTSPNREDHIHILQEDNDLPNGKSITNESEGEPADCDDCCPKCKRTDKYAARLDMEVDPLGRCAWCFVLDGWEYIMASNNILKEQRKPVPKRSGTGTSDKLRRKAFVRMNEEVFRENWVFALERASRARHLVTENWFTLDFLLRNDANVSKITDGFYDSWEQQKYASNFVSLQQWLAWRAAGKPGGLEPAASWSQYGG